MERLVVYTDSSVQRNAEDVIAKGVNRYGYEPEWIMFRQRSQITGRDYYLKTLAVIFGTAIQAIARVNRRRAVTWSECFPPEEWERCHVSYCNGNKIIQKNQSCRRCSECCGYSHHWIPVCDPDRPAVSADCKHCDETGYECPHCSGAGVDPGTGESCDYCGTEGYIEFPF